MYLRKLFVHKSYSSFEKENTIKADREVETSINRVVKAEMFPEGNL